MQVGRYIVRYNGPVRIVLGRYSQQVAKLHQERLYLRRGHLTLKSRRRASGKRSKRVSAGLPDGDSQRPEAVAEEAQSGGNGRAGGQYKEDSSDYMYSDSSSEGGAEEGAGDDSDFQFQRRSTARRSTGSWSPVKRGRASSSAPRHTPQR